MTSRMRRSLKRWRMRRRYPWRNEERHGEGRERPVMPLKPTEGAPPPKARRAAPPGSAPAPQDAGATPAQKPPVAVPPRDVQRLEREVQRLAAGFASIMRAQPAAAAPREDELVGIKERVVGLGDRVASLMQAGAVTDERISEALGRLVELRDRLDSLEENPGDGMIPRTEVQDIRRKLRDHATETQQIGRSIEELRLALDGALERLKDLEGGKDVVEQLTDGSGRVARIENELRELGRGVGTLEGLGDRVEGMEDRLEEVAKGQGRLEQLVPRFREMDEREVADARALESVREQLQRLDARLASTLERVTGLGALGTRIEELERREATDEIARRQLAEVGGRLQNVEGLRDELRALRRRISETERMSGDLESLAARLGSSESTVSRVAAALERRMQQLEGALVGRLDRLAARAAHARPRRPDGERAGPGQSLSDAVAGLRAEIDAIKSGPAREE